MNPFLAVTMLIFAIAGGIIGWRRAGRPSSAPVKGDKEMPAAAGRQDERRRRLHRRFRLTLIYALLGAVIGLVGLQLANRYR